MRTKLAISLFLFVSIYIIFNREEYKQNVFCSDASGYYLYLPAVFIYHDLGNLGFYHEMNKKYSMTGTSDNYGIFDQATGRKTNKYAIGTALFELPFFLIAHAFCCNSGNYPPDGYSQPYQIAGLFSYIFWVSFGLFILGNFLKKQYGDTISAITIICIAFGTNLYYYTVFEPGMSHPFGFVAVSGLIYFTDALYRQPKSRYFYMSGFFLGLITITRPVNIVAVIIPVLWQVYNKQSFGERLSFFRLRIKDIAISIVCFLLVSFIQMWYWKYTSGNWIHYSYEGESFNFLRPHIMDGLFSYQKGWLIYTPVALVAIIGLIYMLGKKNKTAPALFLYLCVMVYIVYSWREWWYGGGFSARAMMESLPVLSLPLAFLIQYIYTCRGIIKKVSFTFILSFFIILNLFQTYQYSTGILNCVYMTRAYYWRIFAKTKVTTEDVKLLKTPEELGHQREDCMK
jgi:hypothetical protein